MTNSGSPVEPGPDLIVLYKLLPIHYFRFPFNPIILYRNDEQSTTTVTSLLDFIYLSKFIYICLLLYGSDISLYCTITTHLSQRICLIISQHSESNA